MAICKHISCRNGFRAVEEYLTMQHDEKGHLLRDRDNNPHPREEYLIDGINCIPESFAPLCLEDRLRFRKRYNPKAIDTHQYIISFAPSDREKGLNMTEAHRFGYQLAKDTFPGHRILVCTHPDGENHSGNIHVHIVISSLRFEDRPIDSRFMRQSRRGGVSASEFKAGFAHQDTARLRHHLMRQINDYCEHRGYEICPSRSFSRSSPEEYFIKSRGIEPRNEQLRRVISDAAATTHNWEEFCEKLATGYTRYVSVVPPVTPAIQKKFWAEYKALNKAFWTWDQTLRTSCQEELNQAFQELKTCKNKEKKKELREKISRLKEKQNKERLFRKTYQTYVKTAFAAMKSRDLEDAQYCLEQMQELSRRREGYWKDGWDHSAGTYSILTGSMESRVTWKQITSEDLLTAQIVSGEINETIRLYQLASKELMEAPLPVATKITRGAVSFRHPDSEYWIRGKRLGENFTLEALGITPPQAPVRSRSRTHSYQR